MRITEYNEIKFQVALDCIIFGFDQEKLKLLLIKRDFEPEKGKWSLMGGFLKINESVDAAAIRILHSLTGLSHVYMDQLNCFGDVDRDPVERTISIAHFALINIQEHNHEISKDYGAKWFDIDNIPKLIFDHRKMVDEAITRLRYQATIQPIGFELLPKKFTMRAMQKLYEAILGTKIDKRNFIKKVNSMDLLIKLDEKDKNSSKKGSYLFKFNKAKFKNKIVNTF